jgi:hypothetical protein
MFFYVYRPYIFLDPSNIIVNTTTNLSIHFITPEVLPLSNESYSLRDITNKNVSNTMKNNSTIVSPNEILGANYPIGICNDSSGNIYILLTNNTISFLDSSGNYFQNYVPESYGLQSALSLTIDSSNNIYVISKYGNYISKITSNSNVVSIDNNYFYAVNQIAITMDTISNDTMYLLSGVYPNYKITKINIQKPENYEILQLPLGTLVYPKSILVSQYDVTQNKYLYVCGTNTFGSNYILYIDLSAGPSPTYYIVSTLINDLPYPNSEISLRHKHHLLTNLNLFFWQ